MTIGAAQPVPESDSDLLDAFCMRCNRKTYVRRGAEMACPVCANPLVATAPNSATDIAEGDA